MENNQIGEIEIGLKLNELLSDIPEDLHKLFGGFLCYGIELNASYFRGETDELIHPSCIIDDYIERMIDIKEDVPDYIIQKYKRLDI